MPTEVRTQAERTAVLETSLADMDEKLTKVVELVEDLHLDYVARKARWDFVGKTTKYIIWAICGLASWAGFDHASAWLSKGIH